MPSTQTRRKRRIGQYLLELRDGAGRTHGDVAELLRKSQTTISKIENGYLLCNFAELGAMLAFYGATEQQRREAQAMWDDAKVDGTRIQVSAAHPVKYRSFVRAEAEAVSIRFMAALAVPGLLQTIDYATAVHAAARRFGTPKDFRRAVQSRRARQQRLHEPDPPAVHALIDEAVLRRRVGGREVMRAQLRHLLELGERQHIVLQVVPFDVGAYGTSSGPTVILGFGATDDPDAVYLEYPGGGSWVENSSDVEAFVLTFDDVADEALSPAESARWMRDLAEQLED
ncbi:MULTISPECIES: helix-turn-helix transcriptional regulator [unclassified Saccharopolyspora]|uniref:helix-turn-helix domain-containing protein n=1 Tax=unclassified Saccharopolyspora TaxID=2646250 RepID=UPI001CD72FD7|nr:MULTISPECIES: helix-turn-helix transcriptional regulator [unclassified Saccharopolyspora]MCA1228685.1 helix-turn-helix domain-containing protein [Saccharopolyspora sp. 6M]MCA1282655.1 helix-turn-helix domain-containing protein [Saccharopolyspora sp. 7B]